MNSKLIPLLTICMIFVGIIACDVSGDESFDFKQGDSLVISGGPGSDTLFLPRYRELIDTTVTPNDTSLVSIQDTATYNVKAFTIDKTYNWEVSPSGQENVYREGEFLDIIVTTADAGTYSISVDNGDYQGSTSLVVVDTTTVQ